VERTAAIHAAEQQQEEQRQEQPLRDRKAAQKKFEVARARWDMEMSQVRRPLYADVEELINTGFLAHQVTVGNTELSLRSLSPSDMFLLRHRCGRQTIERVWKTWTVATSVWMVDGLYLLEDPGAIQKLYQSLRTVPGPVLNILFSTVMGLFNRMSTAVGRTESYCYEPYSRAGWRMCGRRPPTQEGVAGMPGLSRLGLNHVQRMWLAFNLAEDDHDQYLRDWQAAKLVASATSPKGIKKLNQADERLRLREERRRAETILNMCRDAIYGPEAEEHKPWVVVVEGEAVEIEPVRTARTPDELEDQFRSWVAGEKDWHDLVVDTYKERIKERFSKEKTEHVDALGEAMEPGVTGGSRLVGYTPDQLREFRGDLFTKTPKARRVFDSGAPAAVYQKYLAEDPESGAMEADDVGLYVKDLKAEQAGLQEQVSSRKPQFSSEPIDSTSTEGGD